MFYGARWYDPSIGHFLQADTIIPNPWNPLDFDRYAYGRYNPLRYTDPSGHECFDVGDNKICSNDIGYDRKKKINPVDCWLNKNMGLLCPMTLMIGMLEMLLAFILHLEIWIVISAVM